MTSTTGILYPATVAQVVSSNAAWSNESNATASDGASATTTLSALLPASRQLRATNFDFSSIPPDARILGIACRIKVSDNGGGTTVCDSAQLVGGGSPVGDKDDTDMAISAAGPGGAVITYGGQDQLWGLSIQPADLSANLGFQISAKRTGGGTVVVSVDSMALEVWYVRVSAGLRSRRRYQRGR